VRLKTASIGTVVFLVIISLAAGEYWFKERSNPNLPQAQNSSSSPDSTASGSTDTVASPNSTSSEVSAVKKGVSQKLYTGPDVAQILAASQLIPVKTSETSLLKLSAGAETNVTETVLLKNNDRAAFFSWAEAGEVKTLFSALKQALQEQFSPQVKDLVDETRTQETGPPVDYLSFMDPGISPERVVFVRVRTRLYEFHIVQGQEDAINKVIGELSK